MKKIKFNNKSYRTINYVNNFRDILYSVNIITYRCDKLVS